MPLGPKKALPRGHIVYIGLYRENMETKPLSETIRPRALIFGMCSIIKLSYQVFQIMPLRLKKIAPPRGPKFYIGLYREKHEKSSCLKPQGL